MRREKITMGFEKIEPTGGRAGANEPVISLRKSGGIGINNPALDEFFEDAEAAELHYNEEENQLALKPVEEKEPDNYTLTRSDSGGSVTPKGPLKRLDLIPEITTRYEPEWDDDEELVVISLDDEIGTYGSPRSEEDESGSGASGDEETINVE